MDCCLGEKELYCGPSKRLNFCPALSIAIYGVCYGRPPKASTLVSIYKLLDFIAERKTCFCPHGRFPIALMTCYKKCIQGPRWIVLSWNCTRADEIHQPHEIIDQIGSGFSGPILNIADLTGRNRTFSMIGYAHALNKALFC